MDVSERDEGGSAGSALGGKKKGGKEGRTGERR